MGILCESINICLISFIPSTGPARSRHVFDGPTWPSEETSGFYFLWDDRKGGWIRITLQRYNRDWPQAKEGDCGWHCELCRPGMGGWVCVLLLCVLLLFCVSNHWTGILKFICTRCGMQLPESLPQGSWNAGSNSPPSSAHTNLESEVNAGDQGSKPHNWEGNTSVGVHWWWSVPVCSKAVMCSFPDWKSGLMVWRDLISTCPENLNTALEDLRKRNSGLFWKKWSNSGNCCGIFSGNCCRTFSGNLRALRRVM